MLTNNLYELLDIESGEDFMYFENIAALLECDEDVDPNTIYEILLDVDVEVFVEILGEYFDDMESLVPDDETELYTLIINVRRSLIGLATSCDDEDKDNGLLLLADELNRFRDWYSQDSVVEATNELTDEISSVCLRDALALRRLEKISEESYRFDFSETIDYTVDDYIMNIAIEVEDSEYNES